MFHGVERPWRLHDVIPAMGTCARFDALAASLAFPKFSTWLSDPRLFDRRSVCVGQRHDQCGALNSGVAGSGSSSNA